jgi:hypothetical protein
MEFILIQTCQGELSAEQRRFGTLLGCVARSGSVLFFEDVRTDGIVADMAQRDKGL